MNGFEALLSSRLWAWVVHPGLLAGGAFLAAVPLAIHWWSRRRVRTIDWAAMRLLAGAWRREERRTRLEDRALLALRVLAVIAAAVVVARPLSSILPPAADLSEQVRTTGSAGRVTRADREWIVLLDDSLSMKTVGAYGSAFDLAKRRLSELMEARAAVGQDTLTLLVATAPNSPRWEGVPLGAARLDELLAAVDRLACTDAAVDWQATMPAFRRWLESRPAAGRVPRRAILVCSDFREQDWTSIGADATPTKATRASPTGNAPANDSWWLCDVGDNADGNVSVAALASVGPVATGLPFDYLVGVRNSGTRPANAVRVRVSVANTAHQETLIDQLAAGETRTVSFAVRVGDPEAAPRSEEIQVELSIDSPELHNRLAADDNAIDVVLPVPAVEVAIVSNTPSSTDSDSAITGSESPSEDTSAADGQRLSESVAFLENALAPAGPFATGFQVRRYTPSELTPEKLETVRVVVWDDVAEPSLAWIERLEAWVGSGGGLALIPGPNSDPQSWHARLWRDGRGLAPASLRAIQGDPARASWRALGNISPGYTAGRILDRTENPLIDRVKVFRWWDVESPTANTLARFASPTDSPMIMEQAFGAGRVALLAVPPRTGWTDWPLDPSFVIYWQELAQSLGSERVLPQRTLTGAPLHLALPSRRFQASAWLRTPGKTREPMLERVAESGTSAGLSMSAESDTLAESGTLAKSGASVDSSKSSNPRESRNPHWDLASEPLLQAGPHVLELVDAGGNRMEHPFSVLANPRESELRRVASSWRPAGTLAVAQRVPPDVSWTTLMDGPKEWWWWAACGLAAILGAEQALAWNLGRRR